MCRGRTISFPWLVSGWLAVWGCVPGALGHTLPISYLTVVPDDETVHLELTLNPFELNFYAEMDWDKNGRLDASEWEEQEGEITRLILKCLVLRVEGKEISATVAGTTLHLDSHHATLRAHYPADARRWPLTLESRLATLTSGSHFTQVNFGQGTRAQAARLDLFSSSVTFEPLEKASAAGAVPAGLGSGWERPVERSGSELVLAPADPRCGRKLGLGLAGLGVWVVLPVLAWVWAAAGRAPRKHDPPPNPASAAAEIVMSQSPRVL